MTKRGDKPVLLMADDEAFMHNFANLALGKEWRVVGCWTADQVVKTVEQLGSRERVKVALVDYLLPRGRDSELELSTKDLVQFLQDHGIKVGVVTAWMGPETRELGVPVFDKLRVVRDYNEGLQRVVREVQESGRKITKEGE